MATGSVLFTIGYEATDLEAFIDCLVEAKVRELIDVRELLISRKRGFAKTALAVALGEAGIIYRHLRGLGSPRDSRHELRRHGDWPTFESDYMAHLSNVPTEVETVAEAAACHRTAIMCFEADPKCCHRSLLATHLLERDAIGGVEHLRVRTTALAG